MENLTDIFNDIFDLSFVFDFSITQIPDLLYVQQDFILEFSFK